MSQKVRQTRSKRGTGIERKTYLHERCLIHDRTTKPKVYRGRSTRARSALLVPVRLDDADDVPDGGVDDLVAEGRDEAAAHRAAQLLELRAR